MRQEVEGAQVYENLVVHLDINRIFGWFSYGFLADCGGGLFGGRPEWGLPGQFAGPPGRAVAGRYGSFRRPE